MALCTAASVGEQYTNMDQCDHSIQYAGLCGICGKDLSEEQNQDPGFVNEQLNAAIAESGTSIAAPDNSRSSEDREFHQISLTDSLLKVSSSGASSISNQYYLDLFALESSAVVDVLLKYGFSYNPNGTWQKYDDDIFKYADIFESLVDNLKLGLILDLDQTLIHCCIVQCESLDLNDPIPEFGTPFIRINVAKSNASGSMVEEWSFFQKNLHHSDSSNSFSDNAPHSSLVVAYKHNVYPDLFAFKLHQHSNDLYLLKLRPYLLPFLFKLSDIYDLHVYTMGNRRYATVVSCLIKASFEEWLENSPNNTFEQKNMASSQPREVLNEFGSTSSSSEYKHKHLWNDRVITRDESGSFHRKALNRLFPMGGRKSNTKYNNNKDEYSFSESDTDDLLFFQHSPEREYFPMMLILDDRADVWNWMPELVKCKRFEYFRGQGDFNRPSTEKSSNIKNSNLYNIMSCMQDSTLKNSDGIYNHLEILSRVFVNVHSQFKLQYRRFLKRLFSWSLESSGNNIEPWMLLNPITWLEFPDMSDSTIPKFITETKISTASILYYLGQKIFPASDISVEFTACWPSSVYDRRDGKRRRPNWLELGSKAQETIIAAFKSNLFFINAQIKQNLFIDKVPSKSLISQTPVEKFWEYIACREDYQNHHITSSQNAKLISQMATELFQKAGNPVDKILSSLKDDTGESSPLLSHVASNLLCSRYFKFAVGDKSVENCSSDPSSQAGNVDGDDSSNQRGKRRRIDSLGLEEPIGDRNETLNMKMDISSQKSAIRSICMNLLKDLVLIHSQLSRGIIDGTESNEPRKVFMSQPFSHLIVGRGAASVESLSDEAKEILGIGSCPESWIQAMKSPEETMYGQISFKEWENKRTWKLDLVALWNWIIWQLYILEKISPESFEDYLEIPVKTVALDPINYGEIDKMSSEDQMKSTKNMIHDKIKNSDTHIEASCIWHTIFMVRPEWLIDSFEYWKYMGLNEDLYRVFGFRNYGSMADSARSKMLIEYASPSAMNAVIIDFSWINNSIVSQVENLDEQRNQAEQDSLVNYHADTSDNILQKEKKLDLSELVDIEREMDEIFDENESSE